MIIRWHGHWTNDQCRVDLAVTCTCWHHWSTMTMCPNHIISTHTGQVLRQPRPLLFQTISCRLSSPSHYMSRWTFGNKFKWKFNQNSTVFIQGNAFETIVCQMAAICLGFNRDCKSGRHILLHCTSSLWCCWHATLIKIEISHGHLSHYPVLFWPCTKAIIMYHTMFIGVFFRQ